MSDVVQYDWPAHIPRRKTPAARRNGYSFTIDRSHLANSVKVNYTKLIGCSEYIPVNATRSKMAGAMLAMPLLVINMGGEMVYILEQRLHAQSIPAEKSKKVLVDVVRTMYSTKFISELFKPQQIYSNHSTRQIFDRLAHSSIMRLNESSMEKLFDLMTMGFKYQLLSMTCPQQLLQVTLNHLSALKAVVGTSPVGELIDSAVVQTVNTYGDLSVGDFYLLKQVLSRFFQGRRVKVSLFLQDGIQNLDGTIVLRSDGVVPHGGEVPGTMTYYESNGEVANVTNFTCDAQEGSLPTRSTTPSSEGGECTLGMNLYSKDRSGPKKSAAEMVAAAKTAAGGGGAASKLSAKAASKPAAGAGDGGKSTATAELNMLANLMGAAADSAESKPLKISLFADDPFDGAKREAGAIPTINIDATSQRKDLNARMADLDFEDKGAAKGAKGEDEDDLLALMDAA